MALGSPADPSLERQRGLRNGPAATLAQRFTAMPRSRSWTHIFEYAFSNSVFTKAALFWKVMSTSSTTFMQGVALRKDLQ